MRRGELWFADLSPAVGSEAAKRRPVLVVSNDANNRASATITVLPVTSNVERVYPFEVALSKGAGGLSKASKAQAQQIRTISRERISGRRIGLLSHDEMAKVDAALRLHLALDRG
jgi:mRNA interferase MazF